MSEPVCVAEERQVGRRVVCVQAVLERQHHDLMHVEVTDVGSLGCRLNKPGRLSVGSFVTIMVQGLPDLEGWVAWSNPLEAGVTFAYRPPSTVIARLSSGEPTVIG